MSESHQGAGSLEIGEEAYPASCELVVLTEGRMKTGRGRISAKREALWKAFTAKRVVFTFEDGRSFPLIITDFSPGSDTARFQMAGGWLESKT